MPLDPKALAHLLSFIGLCLLTGNAHSYSELTFNYGKERQVYGTNRQNSMTNQSYAGSFSVYIFELTGIEVNYYTSNQVILENDKIDLGSGVSIISSKNVVDIDVFGAGIRQALAPRDSRILPMISLGYAKQYIHGLTSYKINDNGTIKDMKLNESTRRYDSTFASFGINIKLTRFLSLNGSVKSVIKGTKFGEAKNNMKYMAGFSWIF